MKFWPFSRKSVDFSEVLRRIDAASGASSAGISITPDVALGVPAVFAAVRVISEDVAKLPAKLKRRTEGKDPVAAGEPEHRVLSSVGQPASDTGDGFTAMEWIEAVVADAALGGRGVAELNRAGGRVHEVQPVARGAWRHERGVWSLRRDGGTWEVVDRADLFVLRGPQLGRDITRTASDSIALALHLDRFLGSLARKSGRPNGIIWSDAMSSEENATSFAERVKDVFGIGGGGGLLVMDAKIDMTKLSFSPEELQADVTKKAVIEQIASAFRVQPARLMHEMAATTYASAYQFNIAHVTDTIQPWTKRFRQSFDKDVLGRRASEFYCDIELKGLLAGSPQERAAFNLAMRTMGALSPRGVAEIEDMDTDGLSSDPAFPLLTNPNPAAAAAPSGGE